MYIYTTKSGDTISSIAKQFGISATDILNVNFPPNPENLVVGQDFVILIPKTTYTVKIGDSIKKISDRFGISERNILRNNPKISGRYIYEGETLVISYEDNPQKSIITNGYAYTNIDNTLLNKTLPYLTFLSVFTYGFTPDGELVYPNDNDLISSAENYGTLPAMHLSTLTENGTFSSELGSSLLNNPSAIDNIINNIVKNMQLKGYKALDVDFEFLPAEDKTKYADFISRLTETLNPLGYTTLVALAPKTSDNQPGLLYESHDYKSLGNAANFAFLMTYEWGYSYGPPLPVAPIGNVENVVQYALTRISSQKILLGIPLYGYDWTLPYVKGTKAESLSPQRAIELATMYNSEIIYDENYQSPYFYYTDEFSSKHIVWFENAKSVYAKYNLISKYNLAGAGYWNCDRYFPQNWAVLNSTAIPLPY